MGRRSINQNLKHFQNPLIRAKILDEWSTCWQQEQFDFIKRLEQAIKHNDYDELCIVTALIKESALKRFSALNTVLKILNETQGDNK